MPSLSGQQAAVGEHLDDAADVLAALDLELVQRDAPALDRAGAALGDERHQHPAGGLPAASASSARNASSPSRATAPRTPPVRS